jgi:(S)-ureidoglycine aminohydrolase
LGARFSQYSAELEKGATLAPTPHQRFIYILDGELQIELDSKKHKLTPGGYAYLPHGSRPRINSIGASRCAIIEKPYSSADGIPAPKAVFGNESDILSQPLMGDAALQVRSLLPDAIAFDFAVNTMEYQPGASLSMVEVHVMEHGLLMLQGGGIYRLADNWYPVTAGDFIWMSAYCPQWFGALGKTPAKYLIYKDFNRDPLA